MNYKKGLFTLVITAIALFCGITAKPVLAEEQAVDGQKKGNFVLHDRVSINDFTKMYMHSVKVVFLETATLPAYGVEVWFEVPEGIKYAGSTDQRCQKFGPNVKCYFGTLQPGESTVTQTMWEPKIPYNFKQLVKLYRGDKLILEFYKPIVNK